ncbi:MAG: hypothetical protein Q7K45_03025 [Nanoarchaeota archaeon]|nr:hypothetical protein [Nanoarchaeota archaeon]
MNLKHLPLAVALTLGLHSSASAFDIVEKRQNMVLPTQGYVTEVVTYTIRTEEGDTLASIARRLAKEKLVGERVINVSDGIQCLEPVEERLCFQKYKELRGVYAQLEHFNPQVENPSHIPVGTMIQYKAVQFGIGYNNIL